MKNITMRHCLKNLGKCLLLLFLLVASSLGSDDWDSEESDAVELTFLKPALNEDQTGTSLTSPIQQELLNEDDSVRTLCLNLAQDEDYSSSDEDDLYCRRFCSPPIGNCVKILAIGASCTSTILFVYYTLTQISLRPMRFGTWTCNSATGWCCNADTGQCGRY